MTADQRSPRCGHFARPGGRTGRAVSGRRTWQPTERAPYRRARFDDDRDPPARDGADRATLARNRRTAPARSAGRRPAAGPVRRPLTVVLPPSTSSGPHRHQCRWGLLPALTRNTEVVRVSGGQMPDLGTLAAAVSDVAPSPIVMPGGCCLPLGRLSPSRPPGAPLVFLPQPGMAVPVARVLRSEKENICSNVRWSCRR